MENNQNKHLKAFEAFMKDRLKASTDFIRGDFKALKDLSAEKSPASIFPPSGGLVREPAEVNHFNEKGASQFLPGGENEFEVFHQDADERLAYWTGIQRSKVKMQNQPEDVQFNLRITEIFRNDGDQWKLIHRHADQLKSS